MKLYFDLDRTLFRTAELDVVWEKIGELYPTVSAAQAAAEQNKFYIYAEDGTYYHDMSAQLRSLDLAPDSVYAKLIESEIADGRMSFASIGELMHDTRARYEVAILTYGADDYQHFKAALCPALEGIPVVTTLRPKREYLRHQSECWLVDDKPIGDGLPAQVHFIQVSLEGEPVSDKPWPVCYDLDGVRKLLS